MEQDHDDEQVRFDTFMGQILQHLAKRGLLTPKQEERSYNALLQTTAELLKFYESNNNPRRVKFLYQAVMHAKTTLEESRSQRGYTPEVIKIKDTWLRGLLEAGRKEDHKNALEGMKNSNVIDMTPRRIARALKTWK